MTASKAVRKKKAPTKNANTTIKRKIEPFPIAYVPRLVVDLGITEEFLYDAVGCYLDFRKEPEALMKRNLLSDWNFHMFREAVCKVVSVRFSNHIDGKFYEVAYDVLENVGLQLPEWFPDVQVAIIESGFDDSQYPRASIQIHTDQSTVAYDANFGHWTFKTGARPLILPENPNLPATERVPQGVSFGTGLASRLDEIHRYMRIKHPELVRPS